MVVLMCIACWYFEGVLVVGVGLLLNVILLIAGSSYFLLIFGDYVLLVSVADSLFSTCFTSLDCDSSDIF